MTVQQIPALNATLNGIATILISAGFICIRLKKVQAHRRIMLTSAVVSALFLVGYVTYHAKMHGVHTPFGGTGAIRIVYQIILWTHIPLAASIAFLVPRTFAYALQGRIDHHRAWARWTFPIWYYVSITGVLIYFFLYQWWPAAPQ